MATKEQFILLAVREDLGAVAGWGQRNIGDEGWIHLTRTGTRSAGKNPYVVLKLMTSAEACKVRDEAMKHGLNDFHYTVVPVSAFTAPNITAEGV